MEQKFKDFLNNLSTPEVQEFWRFLRTKKLQKWIETRLYNQKID